MTFTFSRVRKKTSKFQGFQGTFQGKEKIQGIFKSLTVFKDRWPPCPYITYSLFQIVSNPSFPVASNPTHTAYSVILFLWLNGWLCHNWCAILLNDIMDVHTSSLRILMLVLCNKASSLLRSDTTCGFSLVLWFDITCTQTHIHTKTHSTLRGQCTDTPI